MTEETILFQIYVKRQLSEAETLQLAAISLQAEDKSHVTCLYTHSSSEDLHVAAFLGKTNTVLNLRHYPSQLLYLFEIHAMNSNVAINLAYIRHIEELVQKYLSEIDALEQVKCLLGPLRRGQAFWRYFVTSDERLIELNFSRLVAEKQTRYQNAKILWGELHGNTLFLDDDAMFAEKEQECYTRVLLGLETGKPPRNNFADKDILILGGGDGGVICELLKQQPRMVTMCEIDIEVVQLCAQHMREGCEDALDTLEGPNKKIIIGDCLDHLHECIQSGKKYDFIINDLTEFMVNKEERGWNYDFATDNSQIMEIALKALKKPNGCYISRGGSLANKHFWTLFEQDCQKLGLRYSSCQSYVPSFYEIYLFYEVRFNDTGSSGDV